MTEKKRTELDWQDIRVFLALGRHGSLSAAARLLAVNHATIARRLRSLEATFGEKLVERRPSGYTLTAAGQRMLAAAGDMESAVQTLGRGGQDGTPRGLVRVNAPPGLALGFLIERLAVVAGRFPGLDIDLAADVRAISLDRHVADIAIRLGRPTDGDVIAKPLGSMAYGFYGTPELCRRIEQGGEPVFVGFDEINVDLPEAAWLARQHPQSRIAFRANNQVGQALAARSGIGLALLPHYIGRQDPALRHCPMPATPPSREIWLLTRRLDRKNIAVRTVVDAVVQLFEENQALFVEE
ncbi:MULTISPECIES: LysR family transcriptional regulator [unclassified Achromobacter]|uniref:LysR family transcriptional regulator n=1 Tax=unclassified Achromobacter TaxID=2626865 RepID=UPI000B51AB1D|nr:MULTISPECIES: LysR family transcriptional regulator [unclassified Achromobacter]OWT77480.1 LysR family transcriptional regulator [Achromobacter sp. HZ28]OWT78361.1 LysR family transcriptional regulator [Achromobacter sp. HZ34]